MTAVIDTCVIIDALQNRKPYSEDAQKLFLAVSNRHINGILTAKSITDIFYILRRGLHNDSLTKECIHKLFLLFEVADTYAVDCQIALGAETKDYEDAVMIETAKRIGADCIITRNIKDYSSAGIPVYSPAEILDKLTDTE
ncbi:MAG: PIN domain-containing protein [Ruminiclostridium sp.]